METDSRQMQDFRPFGQPARRRARDRAARLIVGRGQLLQHVEAELTARADLLGPAPEGPSLRIGLLLPPPPGTTGLDPSARLAALHGGLQGDEDQRHFPDESFAHITALMTLHGVNDLPGALLLCRRALKPGGRFQAVFPAGFSAGLVRDAFLDADIAAGGGVPPRLGPTVDPAEAAGLLQRAGFQEPVAEVETLTLRYRTLADFARDARAHGDSGWLAARARGLTTPRRWALAEAAFAAHAGADGRVPVEVQLLHLSGRAAPTASG
ncbi:methyltransferase domain-containing protein [Sandaracinobacteroides sayramensis]|uniref:methyltransferase domain-containing protein n=1 Tax=Sandaracinobacteroides sayramensis TaxID=2913411 RepID=UPI002342ECF0|nr:methyltransferase domain-containing protein [Sandaracinobacteroides sayramensis]